jgi:hypothetical protein
MILSYFLLLSLSKRLKEKNNKISELIFNIIMFL